MQHLQPNTTLQGGKYRIERLLGQGGFGNTYMAKNTVFDDYVAIKEFFMQGLNDRDEASGSITIGIESNKTQFEEEKPMPCDFSNHDSGGRTAELPCSAFAASVSPRKITPSAGNAGAFSDFTDGFFPVIERMYSDNSFAAVFSDFEAWSEILISKPERQIPQARISSSARQFFISGNQ